MRLFKILIFHFFSEIEKKSKFFLSSKGPPFNLFDILNQTGFSKNPNDPPFTSLKTMRFLSLGYSADFRRSRLVKSVERLGYRIIPVRVDLVHVTVTRGSLRQNLFHKPR